MQSIAVRQLFEGHNRSSIRCVVRKEFQVRGRKKGVHVPGAWKAE